MGVGTGLPEGGSIGEVLRPLLSQIKRLAALSGHGHIYLFRLDKPDRPVRPFCTMYVCKQDWDRVTGLLRVEWDWRAMQCGKNWERPGVPWQKRIER